eukprot:6021334-Alexandrium_andersonii.AAC.1
MSASLVGSEMCIRDRAFPALASMLRTGGLSPPTEPLRPGAPLPRGPGPVSYTHLTLPTICSV